MPFTQGLYSSVGLASLDPDEASAVAFERVGAAEVVGDMLSPGLTLLLVTSAAKLTRFSSPVDPFRLVFFFAKPPGPTFAPFPFKLSPPRPLVEAASWDEESESLCCEGVFLEVPTDDWDGWVAGGVVAGVLATPLALVLLGNEPGVVLCGVGGIIG